MSIEREVLRGLIKSLAPDADSAVIQKIIDKIEKHHRLRISRVIQSEMYKKQLH